MRRNRIWILQSVGYRTNCAMAILYFYCLCEAYSKFVNGENVEMVVPIYFFILKFNFESPSSSHNFIIISFQNMSEKSLNNAAPFILLCRIKSFFLREINLHYVHLLTESDFSEEFNMLYRV